MTILVSIPVSEIDRKYQSLRKENVEIAYGTVTGLTASGCESDDGHEYSLDILICATGFHGSFVPRFPIIGPRGLNLQDAWKEEPQSYLGIAAAKFPNLFMFLGPHSPVTNGPLVAAIGKPRIRCLTCIG